MNEVRKAKIQEYEAEAKKLDGECNVLAETSAKLLDELFNAIEKEGSEHMKALVVKINANAEMVLKYKERINEIKNRILKIALFEFANKLVEDEGLEEEETTK